MIQIAPFGWYDQQRGAPRENGGSPVLPQKQRATGGKSSFLCPVVYSFVMNSTVTG